MDILVWVALIGVVAGLLAGMLGIGGGLVIVPALLFVLDQMGSSVPMQQAVATSLASIIATGAVSAWSHHNRGAVDWHNVRLLAPGICLGASVGAVVAGWISSEWLKLVFALFATWVGALMLKPDKGPPTIRHISRVQSLWLAPLIGALSALVGIGGGSMTVPFLSAHGVNMQRAVATASAIGVFLALAGAVVFAVTTPSDGASAANSLGLVHLPSLLAITATSMLSAPLGVRLAHRAPSATLKRVFGGFLLLMALWIGFG
ncbi:MAG: UPF0721 transmembrane protein [Lysobacteraceae bacterium]|nr:MAG: UPF0721 transmembrane protein [Xanthomonadaceae bacterium]